MPSPFPGMDPYVEDPAVWPDCHDSLITALRGALQPLLLPQYAAITRDRQVVISPRHPRYPDVSVVRSGQRSTGKGGRTAAILPADKPLVFEESDEREPYLEILEARTNRLVTAIEVLNPDNKRPEPGRRSYLRKRRELRRRGANFVEIDLLRAGQRTVHLSEQQWRNSQPFHYVVVVSRLAPAQREVYPIALARPLPRVAVPLDEGTRDVPLDLQAAFTRTWDESGYPAVIDYDGPPVGVLSPEELAWCEKLLRKAKLRHGR